jgi:NADH-quinone oxidoreductase subunit E/NADP-reducing hydrogenase subunit HndA
MENKKTKVPYAGTPEQEAKLREIIAQYRGVPGGTMPVMQQAQEIFGYLPLEVQQIIADGLGISVKEVYGIATFYSLFTLNPKGKYRISVCLGTACYVKGSQQILDKIVEILDCPVGSISNDGRFSVDAARCIGACGLAPVIMINDDVYGRLTPDMIPDILAKYQ